MIERCEFQSGALRPRLVLVEDNADARETMRILLEEDGFEVLVAATGPEGLQQIIAALPDVAIVDIGLPELDGYAIARAVRSAAGGHQIYLIALTGHGESEDRQLALEAGFDVHLSKPVDLEALTKMLAR